MLIQKLIQPPKTTEFRPIGTGKNILPYPVRLADGRTYYDEYFHGIEQIESLKERYPECRLFIPSAADMRVLYKTVDPFLIGTGSVILRPNYNGYADKYVIHQDGSRVNLRCPTITNHGSSWITDKYGRMVIIDESKLMEYSEIASAPFGWQFVQGYDNDRGVPIKFGAKPLEEFLWERTFIDPRILVAPIQSGFNFVVSPKWLHQSTLGWYCYLPHWNFSLGVQS